MHIKTQEMLRFICVNGSDEEGLGREMHKKPKKRSDLYV